MAMDVKREGVAKKKMIKRIIYLTLTVAVVAVASWQISKLKPAAPTVERATVWIDSVKRGPMVRGPPRSGHAGSRGYSSDSGPVRQPGRQDRKAFRRRSETRRRFCWY